MWPALAFRRGGVATTVASRGKAGRVGIPDRECERKGRYIMADFDEMRNSEEYRELIENIRENYKAARESLMRKDFRNNFISSSAHTSDMMKGVVRELYDEFKDDGNFFSIILGVVSAQALGNHLAVDLARGNWDSFIGNLTTKCTIPMYQSFVDEFAREELERGEF